MCGIVGAVAQRRPVGDRALPDAHHRDLACMRGVLGLEHLGERRRSLEAEACRRGGGLGHHRRSPRRRVEGLRRPGDAGAQPGAGAVAHLHRADGRLAAEEGA